MKTQSSTHRLTIAVQLFHLRTIYCFTQIRKNLLSINWPNVLLFSLDTDFFVKPLKALKSNLIFFK